MDATALGHALDHYRLEAPLGIGWHGAVFLAKDTRLSRQVAVKVLPADRLDEQARQRLRDEAFTLSRLSHPNIAAVFDFGSQAEIDYLVMEYVPGTTLDALLQRGPLESETVARLGVQLARGLAAAHACGIVHRDIKPGNVRVTPDGLLKILDFGVATFALPSPEAKTTAGFFDRTPALAGTIRYMAPERLRGNPGRSADRHLQRGRASLRDGVRAAAVQRSAADPADRIDPEREADAAVCDQPADRSGAGVGRPAGARSGSGLALRAGSRPGRRARSGGGPAAPRRPSTSAVARWASKLASALLM